jgi:hypothetical protein
MYSYLAIYLSSCLTQVLRNAYDVKQFLQQFFGCGFGQRLFSTLSLNPILIGILLLDDFCSAFQQL